MNDAPQVDYSSNEDDDSFSAGEIVGSRARVSRKQNTSGARFIWTSDLDIDNTVIFRYRVERPGWRPRWNTKPDLDNRCLILTPPDCPCLVPQFHPRSPK